MHRINKNSVWLVLMKIGASTGCHQKPRRSFFVNKCQFPVCARCTGVIIGYMLAVTAFGFFMTSLPVCILLCLIMFLDWFVQYLKICDSTNIRRLITGIMGGYGLLSFEINGLTQIIILIYEHI